MIGQRLLSLIETDYLESVGQALLLEIIGFYLTLRILSYFVLIRYSMVELICDLFDVFICVKLPLHFKDIHEARMD